MNGADDPTEVELTLRVAPGSVSRLLRDPLLRKLKQGPRASRVDEVIEEDAADEVVRTKSFQIEGAW